MRGIAFVVIVMLIGAGCASPGLTDESTTSSPATTEPVAPAPPTSTTPSETVLPALASVAERAIADLSERLGVENSEIAVDTVEEVTWLDGSIGCPVDGDLYTQALEEGTLVILEHDGEQYSYHQKQFEEPFWCSNPSDDARFIKPLAPP